MPCSTTTLPLRTPCSRVQPAQPLRTTVVQKFKGSILNTNHLNSKLGVCRTAYSVQPR